MYEVFRLWETGKSTCGMLAIDGVFECYTLEPAAGPERVPAATYQVKVELSPKFERFTPHLLDVPGHTYEEIHYGNGPDDTLGCTLVGQTHGVDWVGNSRVAFDALMAKLPPAFAITYHDPPK